MSNRKEIEQTTYAGSIRLLFGRTWQDGKPAHSRSPCRAHNVNRRHVYASMIDSGALRVSKKETNENRGTEQRILISIYIELGAGQTAYFPKRNA